MDNKDLIINWYPGHMTKAMRSMKEDIRLVDLIIELVDARAPVSSENPDIAALCINIWKDYTTSIKKSKYFCNTPLSTIVWIT